MAEAKKEKRRKGMTTQEYKKFLIEGILEFQKNNLFDKETLEKKSIRVLERIYDTV